MPKCKCFPRVCPQSSLLSVLSLVNHTLFEHGILFQGLNSIKEISHIQLRKSHFSFMMVPVTMVMTATRTVVVEVMATARTHWVLSPHQVLLYLLPHTISFNPHSNPMKYLLFLFILKTRELRDKELTNCEGNTVSDRVINTTLKNTEWNRSPNKPWRLWSVYIQQGCQETIWRGKNSLFNKHC